MQRLPLYHSCFFRALFANQVLLCLATWYAALVNVDLGCRRASLLFVPYVKSVSACLSSALPLSFAIILFLFQVVVNASSEGQGIASSAGLVGEPFSLSVPQAHLWSFDDPFLYDLDVTLLDGSNKDAETVSYCTCHSNFTCHRRVTCHCSVTCHQSVTCHSSFTCRNSATCHCSVTCHGNFTRHRSGTCHCSITRHSALTCHMSTSGKPP